MKRIAACALLSSLLILPACSAEDLSNPSHFTPDLYDCTSSKRLPQPRSPVPLDCVINSDCHGQPMVVAHRGAGGEGAVLAPENSLAAIRAAAWMGVDGVELDARDTADGKLILMHDAETRRTTGVDARVEDLTLDEIHRLPLLADPDRFSGDYTCETVPTLDEAFALTRGRLFVDLDTKTSRVDLVVLAIQKAGLRDQVFVSVSDPGRAIEARLLDPGIRIQVRPDTPEDVSRYLAAFDRPPEVVEIPWAIAPEVKSRVPADSKLFSDVFAEDAATALLASTAKAETSQYRAVLDAGIEIMQTEYPAVVLRSLARWTFDENPWGWVPGSKLAGGRDEGTR
ncbi:MAG: glycerophosphodiester phosphodiesterase family protein [Nitrospirae bacterium]|nr:glycerophosphodiester phosphodiesterase family protein [Nitrospirota bacterium]